MPQDEQPLPDVVTFATAMEKLINHYTSEFNLTYTEIIGVMEIQKNILLQDNYNQLIFGEIDEIQDDSDLDEVSF